MRYFLFLVVYLFFFYLGNQSFVVDTLIKSAVTLNYA